MKVKELREALKGVPDELEVVTTGTDHKYHKVYAAVKQFAEQQGMAIWEYYNDANMIEGSKKVEVFVVE